MVTSTKPWADGPYALITASGVPKCTEKRTGVEEIVAEMIIVHNFLIRIINSVVLQAENVSARGTPQDIQDFAHYALEWVKIVEEHHHEEETNLFPGIEKLAGAPGIMTGNIEQHAAFHPGLEEFEAYLEAVLAGREAFDGRRLRAIIESFAPVLREHLNDEIGTLRQLDRYADKVDWKAWWDAVVKEIMAKSNDDKFKTTAFPLVMTAHEKSYGDGAFANWPPFPWFVGLIFQWFYVPKHKAWWRFAPCDAKGVRKELPFA